LFAQEQILSCQSRAAPPDTGEETDLTALTKGFITLTPLQYNMTRHDVLTDMERSWTLEVPQ